MNDISSSKLLIQAIVFIVLGVIIILCMVRVAQINIMKKNSPKVLGTIIKAESRAGPTPDRGSSVRASGYVWNFSVEYKYNVEGEEFVGRSLYSDNDSAMEGINSGDLDAPKPERIITLEQTYPVGKSVNVYYSKKRPNNLFLIYRSRPWVFIIVFIFAASFLSAGIYMLVRYLK